MNAIINFFNKAAQKVNELMTGMIARAQAAAEEVREDDRGASDIVAVVVIILVVLAVAVVFRQTLINAITALGTRITDWINNN